MTGFLRILWRRLRREPWDAELLEELETHIEMKAAETGDRPAARRDLGNVTLLMEDSRAAWGWPRMEGWLRDFRYALRVLVRKPGFAATVILTLALGVGASSTIFSLIDTVLLRPLPYPDSARLVAIHEAKPADQFAQTPVAPGRLEDWQRLTRAFDAVAGSAGNSFTDTTGMVPERLYGADVSPRFFAVIGTPAALGRTFTAQEEEYGGPLSVVISEGLWRRRFFADPEILGRNLVLGGRSYKVVGVMPPGFQYPSPSTELWLPKQAPPGVLRLREARFYDCIGRLRPGITLEQARAELAAVQRKLGEQYPKTDAGWTVVLEPLKDRIVGNVRFALWLLLGSVSLLLLIACANVACLLLARLNGRTAEIATRLALGAGRAAIARQLLAEGLAYAAAGGLAGMALAFAAVELLRKRLPGMPRITELSVNGRMLLVVAGISMLSVLLFSLAPILQTLRSGLGSSMTQAGRSLVGRSQRLPRSLVAAQLALATALLIGAGLFLRSLNRLEEVPLGFHPENVLALRIGAAFNESPASAMERHRRTLDALASAPGVTAAAMSSGLPGVTETWPREFEIAGRPAPGGTLRFAAWRIVTAGYFQTVGIPILAGRTCRMNAGAEHPFEALVNRQFADRYFRGMNPVDRTILGGPIGDTRTRIVGVVADAREDGRNSEPQPLIYACGYLRYWPDADFLIRAEHPAALAGSIGQAIRAIDPSRAVYSVRPLGSALDEALSQTRFRTFLVSLFSLMALALSAIGLYGVMAYMVSQRTREIGLRLALGAPPARILGEILRSGGVLAAGGGAAGVAIGALSARALSSLLYGVEPLDLSSYLMAGAVLGGAALAACLAPARRAMSIDPTEALREQ
jgi:putative ABC transport system permease protein